MTDNHDQTDVWYHGIGSGSGPRPIVVETGDGKPMGALRHVVRHSPTGMTWGYGGSGPADTARSLLIAALGEQAYCPTCGGTGKVVYDPTEEAGPTQPFHPDRDRASYELAGLEVSGCWDADCDDGYTHVPYQQFKWDHVASWGSEWRMSRAQILDWLHQNDQSPVARMAARDAPDGDPRTGPRRGTAEKTVCEVRPD